MKMNKTNYDKAKEVFDYILENANDMQWLYIAGCLETCFEVALKEAKGLAMKEERKKNKMN